MEDMVLVGVDGSSESLDAARWALTEASLRRWSVWFARVSPPAQVVDPQVDVAYRHSAMQAADPVFGELEAAAKDLRVPVHFSLLFGQAGDVLVRLSARAGLNVVGHRHRTGLPSRLDSVAATLAAHAQCPTAVIPSSDHSQANSTYDRPAADQSQFAGQIVAAVEPGPAAATVLSVAADIAQRHNRPLNAVTVGPATEDQSVLRDLLTHLQAKHPGLRCSVHTLSGRPVHEITEAARDSWLLVVGTRGISGLPGMLRGSVSQALLQHVTSPVLVVPSPHSGEPE
ncbi:universal stress protein [Citricoccus nitrophenolicus]